MEDEAYARRLFANLTNPDPSGIDPETRTGKLTMGSTATTVSVETSGWSRWRSPEVSTERSSSSSSDWRFLRFRTFRAFRSGDALGSPLMRSGAS